MKRALIIRHHEAETMGGNFRAILERCGFEFIACNIFESAPRHDRFDAPPPDEVELIMAFGGPMSVNDDLPALHCEREYMQEAMVQGQAGLRRLPGSADDVHGAGRDGGTQRRLPVRAA